jgi:uncharacterized membrane protein YgcG
MSEQILKEVKAELESVKATLSAIAPLVVHLADVATSQLDSEKGDPSIPFDPRGWRGDSFKGRRFSEAPPEFLDMLASFFTFSANNPKEGKEQYAGSDRFKASLALGWAYRKRIGGAAAAPARNNGGPRQNSGGGYGGNGGSRSAGGGGYGSSGGYGGAPADDFGGGNLDDEIPFVSSSMYHDLRRSGL